MLIGFGIVISGAHIGPEPTTDRFVVVMMSVVFLAIQLQCKQTCHLVASASLAQLSFPSLSAPSCLIL
jgi:hypothetical protein